MNYNLSKGRFSSNIICTLLAGSKEERTDVIKLIIKAFKHVNKHGTSDERSKRLMQFFNKTDEKRCTILELAVEEDYLDVVRLILEKNPAYHRPERYPDLIGIMPLIYKVMDKENNAMVNLLTRAYQRGVRIVESQMTVETRKAANMHKMISAIDSARKVHIMSFMQILFKYNTLDVKVYVESREQSYIVFLRIILKLQGVLFKTINNKQLF